MFSSYGNMTTTAKSVVTLPSIVIEDEDDSAS